MNIRTRLYGIAHVLLGFCYFAIAADIPNFSGIWVLDQEQSVMYGNALKIKNSDLSRRFLITHAGNRLIVENQCGQAHCGDTVRRYVTDGKQHNMPNDKDAVIIYTANWKENVIVIDESIAIKGPFGSAVSNSIHSWSLSKDKHLLTISRSGRDSKGSIQIIQTFKRVQ
jgi:hypothetical protein